MRPNIQKPSIDSVAATPYTPNPFETALYRSLEYFNGGIQGIGNYFQNLSTKARKAILITVLGALVAYGSGCVSTQPQKGPETPAASTYTQRKGGKEMYRIKPQRTVDIAELVENLVSIPEPNCPK